jgi:hypothetical protein
MQVSTLILQQDLKCSLLLPIRVSLGLFVQYPDATVNQVIAYSIFNTYLQSRLKTLGLSRLQIVLLLQWVMAMGNVRHTTKGNLSAMFVPALEAYSFATTWVYVKSQ